MFAVMITALKSLADNQTMFILERIFTLWLDHLDVIRLWKYFNCIANNLQFASYNQPSNVSQNSHVLLEIFF